MSKRILVFSTFDWGGAGESSLRITRSLRELGHEAVLIVRHKKNNEDFIIQAQESHQRPTSLISRIAVRASEKIRNKVKQVVNGQSLSVPYETDYNFYFNTKDENVGFSNIEQLIHDFPFEPDLVLVGWVSQFLNTYDMQAISQATKVPVYWITTDMAPLTGGCHYAWDCSGYTRDCADCPAILTEKFKQDAKRNLALKLRSIQAGNIKVLAGSEWCRRQAETSTLFSHQKDILVLNGVIDQAVFNNRCRGIAKQVFGISNDDKIIFTGATFTAEKRKGIKYLVESLQYLHAQLSPNERTKVKILVAGKQVQNNEFVQKIPFEVIPFEFIKDDRLLSLAYQAADLFVCSSIEDSGPMMVNEALACGTPVIGFDLGFVADIVEHGRNGYRIPLKDTRLMAKYMQQVLTFSSIEFLEFSKNSIEAIDSKVSVQNLEKVIVKIAI